MPDPAAQPLNVSINPLDQFDPSEKQFVADAGRAAPPAAFNLLPFLTEPKSLFSLLLGKDINLVTLDLPKLTLVPHYHEAFLIFPPFLTIVLGRPGSVFPGQLSFGYDTYVA